LSRRANANANPDLPVAVGPQITIKMGIGEFSTNVSELKSFYLKIATDQSLTKK
jgi:hypothetical protein